MCPFYGVQFIGELSTLNGQLSAVNCQLSAVNCQLELIVHCQLSIVHLNTVPTAGSDGEKIALLGGVVAIEKGGVFRMFRLLCQELNMRFE